MANEICTTGSLSIFKTGVTGNTVGRSVVGALFTMTGSAYIEAILSVGITATVIPLGGVAAPHWAYFQNRDATNFLTIRNGASGADLIKLLPGEWCIVPLYDSAVPYALASVAPVIMEYLIASL